MNFVCDIVEAFAPDRRALVAIDHEGRRSEHTFGEVCDRSARLAGTLTAHGVGPGDVVLTLIGSTPDWVHAMLACFRIGAVALPCNEMLRARDLRLRIEASDPKLILAGPRDLDELGAARPGCPVLTVGDEALYDAEPAAAADLDGDDPCLIVFTSGSTGEPRGVVHRQAYLPSQILQAQAWFGAPEGELAWCTAATGWSKSARNAFIAPWMCNAAAMLHDARFDAEQRLDLIEREGVAAICMAPTEYRVIAKRAGLRPLPGLRSMVAAGEALNPEILHLWREATGVDVRDGYGQTETGHLTANRPGEPARPGSMGRPLPGIDLWLQDGEIVVDPATVPTFFLRYLDGEPAPRGPWRTGDRAHADADGHLFFESRADDMIISSGYRIGPFEVESALVGHPAVAEAAVVSAPDDERGSVVRAVVVLRAGIEPGDGLVAELQDHVRTITAPYKYPRIIEFAEELPKTASGKVRRAELRGATG